MIRIGTYERRDSSHHHFKIIALTDIFSSFVVLGMNSVQCIEQVAPTATATVVPIESKTLLHERMTRSKTLPLSS